MEKQHKGFLGTDAKHLMIVFGCMLIQAIPYGLAQNVPPLFIRYLHIDFHFNMANIGLIITMGAVAASFISPIGGKFFSKFSTRLVMICALLLSCCGLFMNAFGHAYSTYLIANAIIQIGSIGYSGLGIPYLIGLWFDKDKKAQALGLAFAGGSIGNFFLQPIFTHLLHRYALNSVPGLHFIYFIAASVSLVVGLLIMIFFIHDYKGENTSDASDKSKSNSIENKLTGIGSKAVRKLSSFWILAIGMFFVGESISAQSFQYANFFEELHIPTVIVGTVGSVYAVACLCGNTGGGFLYAKLGLHKASLIAFGLQLTSCLSMIALYFTNFKGLAFAWAILYGLSVFIYMSGPAIIIQGLFGMKESSETLGIFSIFFAVGFALGNVIFGAIVDSFGYLAAWLVTLVFLLIGFIILTTMINKIEKKHYDQYNSLAEVK